MRKGAVPTWKVNEGSVEGQWKVRGRSVEGQWKVNEGSVQGQWKVRGRSVEGQWKVSGRSVEGQWRAMEGHGSMKTGAVPASATRSAFVSSWGDQWRSHLRHELCICELAQPPPHL